MDDRERFYANHEREREGMKIKPAPITLRKIEESILLRYQLTKIMVARVPFRLLSPSLMQSLRRLK